MLVGEYLPIYRQNQGADGREHDGKQYVVEVDMPRLLATSLTDSIASFNSIKIITRKVAMVCLQSRNFDVGKHLSRKFIFFNFLLSKDSRNISNVGHIFDNQIAIFKVFRAV